MDGHTAPLASSRTATPDGHAPATSATVGLATAASALGISQAIAQDLAERDEFPCTVIRATGGYRVPFTALLRLLRSQPSQSTAVQRER